jgi:hypothetical protein
MKTEQYLSEAKELAEKGEIGEGVINILLSLLELDPENQQGTIFSDIF